MNLTDSRVRACVLRHVQDPLPERVRLRRDAKPRAERRLQDLLRWSCEDGACRSGHPCACCGVRLSRAEPIGTSIAITAAAASSLKSVSTGDKTWSVAN